VAQVTRGSRGTGALFGSRNAFDFLLYSGTMIPRAMLLVLAVAFFGAAPCLALTVAWPPPQEPAAPKAAPLNPADGESEPCLSENPGRPGDGSPKLGKITKGMLIRRVDPSYSGKAKRAGIQGTVVMCADIGTDGTITKLKAVSGPPELIPSAMKAVQKWRYKPYLLDGEPIALRTTVRVTFSLGR